MGAVGLPEFDNASPEKQSGERDCSASARRWRVREPASGASYKSLVESSPLKNHLVDGTDMIIVRELTGGMYYGTPRGISGSGPEERAVNTMVYTRAEIERVARMAFHLARGRRKKLTYRRQIERTGEFQLWRRVVTEVAKDFPMSPSITYWSTTARCSWCSIRNVSTSS
jgi:3-isopropylmalate dehydrogenase